MPVTLPPLVMPGWLAYLEALKGLTPAGWHVPVMAAGPPRNKMTMHYARACPEL